LVGTVITGAICSLSPLSVKENTGQESPIQSIIQILILKKKDTFIIFLFYVLLAKLILANKPLFLWQGIRGWKPLPQSAAAKVRGRLNLHC